MNQHTNKKKRKVKDTKHLRAPRLPIFDGRPRVEASFLNLKKKDVYY
jgi:hypothetical protein